MNSPPKPPLGGIHICGNGVALLLEDMLYLLPLHFTYKVRELCIHISRVTTDGSGVCPKPLVSTHGSPLDQSETTPVAGVIGASGTPSQMLGLNLDSCLMFPMRVASFLCL